MPDQRIYHGELAPMEAIDVRPANCPDCDKQMMVAIRAGRTWFTEFGHNYRVHRCPDPRERLIEDIKSDLRPTEYLPEPAEPSPPPERTPDPEPVEDLS